MIILFPPLDLESKGNTLFLKRISSAVALITFCIIFVIS